MSPEQHSYTFTENISVNVNYTVKSNISMINGLTLLRLPGEALG